MLPSQRNAYVQTQMQTASKSQLLIMLYDGAIRFCKQSMDAIQRKNYVDANTNLQKVQSIINELVITLDLKYPIAQDLLRIYDYWLYRLLNANVKKDITAVQEVMNQLIEIKEAWIQINKSPSAAGAEAGHG